MIYDYLAYADMFHWRHDSMPKKLEMKLKKQKIKKFLLANKKKK